jgi:hypothetical protein
MSLCTPRGLVKRVQPDASNSTVDEASQFARSCSGVPILGRARRPRSPLRTSPVQRVRAQDVGVGSRGPSTSARRALRRHLDRAPAGPLAPPTPDARPHDVRQRRRAGRRRLDGDHRSLALERRGRGGSRSPSRLADRRPLARWPCEHVDRGPVARPLPGSTRAGEFDNSGH